MQTAKHNFDFVDLFARFFHFKGRLIPQFRKREHHKRNLFLMVQHLLIQGFRIFCLLRCIRSRLFPARDPLDNFHNFSSFFIYFCLTLWYNYHKAFYTLLYWYANIITHLNGFVNKKNSLKRIYVNCNQK